MDKNIENLFLQKITGFNKNQLFLCDKNLKEKYKKELENLINRYNLWEPIEYIIEKAEFYGLDFFVDKRVLIPRNDTEIMVEQALKTIKWTNNILIDVWTWSSCIAISILKNTTFLKKAYVIDISKKALEVSQINIKKHNLENKIIQIHWNLLDFLFKKENFLEKNNNIIITANLPYIKNWDFENMDKETIKFEPNIALFWWKKTGFELYEKLIYQIEKLKNNYKNIILFIEIWFDQKEIATNFLNQKKLHFEVFKDNSWIDRLLKINF